MTGDGDRQPHPGPHHGVREAKHHCHRVGDREGEVRTLIITITHSRDTQYRYHKVRTLTITIAHFRDTYYHSL